MQISFISSLDRGEIRTIDSKSDNIEITMCNEADDIVKELFESFEKRYQERLETKMKGSQFVFESVDLLYYSLHWIGLNRGESCIDSPEWLKNKKATINPKNVDNECLKHTIIAALNHKKIKNQPERISNLKSFTD